MFPKLVFVCVWALISFGCKDNEACNKARFALAKTWRSMSESAARRQLGGVDIEGWKFVQGRAQLLESSFMTTQVTWDSADKARKEIAERAGGLQSDAPANVEGFRLSLKAALDEQDAFAKKCR